MNTKLTVKQEVFCNAYIENGGNASEAYRQAFSCENMKPETINRNAFGMLRKSKIATRINELQAELKERSDITKERILEELTYILNAKITDYVEFDGKILKFKDFDDLTDSQIKAIESIKQGKNGIELKLHGKCWTIERLCKMLGFDVPEKKDVKMDISDIPKEVRIIFENMD